MITIKCDGCGKELKRHELRYTVTIDVRAAYDELEIGLADLMRDYRSEIIALIEQLKSKNPKEVEETVYKNIKLDLCPNCQNAYINGPLRFHPEQGVLDNSIDIDSFLRSLGYGKGDKESQA